MKRVWLVVAVATVMALVADLAGGATPLWTALTGFGGSVLLIVVAKGLGTALLRRPEAYYGEER
jgi:hypothetical protein